MSKGIVDFIIRIKNSYSARKDNAEVSYSKINQNILEVLKKENFIKDFRLVEVGAKKTLEVELLYHGLKAAVSDVKLVTKPGRRIYSKAKDLKTVMGGFGLAILSTPKGIITDKQAKDGRIGGEVLFKIW